MTDRINGLTITLDRDYREDDVEAIVNAIRMVRGVADVSLNVVMASDHFSVTRHTIEFRAAIREFAERFELK